MASSTRPGWLTHIKRYLTAFYTAMVTLNGDLPRRLDQSIAKHSNWPASISSHDLLVGMLGLRHACGHQEVIIEYNKSLKLIHPDHCVLDGAAEVFMKFQPVYTEWTTARARQGWSPPAASSSAPVNSDSRHLNNRPSSHGEGRGGLGARPPLASQSTRPGVPQQRTGAESAPSGSNSTNVSQNVDFNSAPAHDNIFRYFISSLNHYDSSVTWINAGALDFLSRLERDGRLFELRAFTSPTTTVLNDIQRSSFKDCVKKTLTMAGRFFRDRKVYYKTTTNRGKR